MRSARRIGLCLAVEAVGCDFVRTQMAEVMAQAAAAQKAGAAFLPQPVAARAQTLSAINHAASQDEPQSFADFVTQHQARRPNPPKVQITSTIELAPLTQKTSRRGCASFCDESTCFQESYPECRECGTEDGCHLPPSPSPPKQPPPVPTPSSPFPPSPRKPPPPAHLQHHGLNGRHSPPLPDHHAAVTRHERLERSRLKAPLPRSSTPLLPREEEEEEEEGLDTWQVAGAFYTRLPGPRTCPLSLCRAAVYLVLASHCSFLHTVTPPPPSFVV